MAILVKYWLFRVNLAGYVGKNWDMRFPKKKSLHLYLEQRHVPAVSIPGFGFALLPGCQFGTERKAAVRLCSASAVTALLLYSRGFSSLPPPPPHRSPADSYRTPSGTPGRSPSSRTHASGTQHYETPQGHCTRQHLRATSGWSCCEWLGRRFAGLTGVLHAPTLGRCCGIQSRRHETGIFNANDR